MPEDHDLRDGFAKLRREDQAQAGEFQDSLRRARPRMAPVRRALWVAAAASLAVFIAVGVRSLQRPGQRNPASPDVSITEWRSSTDFLLRTPGAEILHTVPRIGELPAYTGTPGESRPTPAIRKKNVTKLWIEENLS